MTATATTTKTLFTPVTLGPMHLKHRVVMAPLTRSRAEGPGWIPGELMRRYYTERASEGGLIISEATNISPASRGWMGAPGIYSDGQVAGWHDIVSAVHAKGGFMVSQLWHTGRSSHSDLIGGAMPVSASVNPEYWEDADHLVSGPSGWVQPSPHRALEIEEIQAIVEDYRRAGERANEAGFDAVEVHAANGYLMDQFLQDGSNKRTDRYGGSVENRTRFLLEVVDALCAALGSERVAVRIAPSGRWNGMGDSNPRALFNALAAALDARKLGYLHVIEPRVRGNIVVAEGNGPVAAEELRGIFKGKIVAAGGFEPDTAEAVLEKGSADAVAFGRHFVSNPDLPLRIQSDEPLAPYDRNTFYTFDERGYIDYPTYQEGR